MQYLFGNLFSMIDRFKYLQVCTNGYDILILFLDWFANLLIKYLFLKEKNISLLS